MLLSTCFSHEVEWIYLAANHSDKSREDSQNTQFLFIPLGVAFHIVVSRS